MTPQILITSCEEKRRERHQWHGHSRRVSSDKAEADATAEINWLQSALKLWCGMKWGGSGGDGGGGVPSTPFGTVANGAKRMATRNRWGYDGQAVVDCKKGEECRLLLRIC